MSELYSAFVRQIIFYQSFIFQLFIFKKNINLCKNLEFEITRSHKLDFFNLDIRHFY